MDIRDEHLIVEEIVRLLGGRERVAKEMKLKKSRVDKHCQPPNKNGRRMTRQFLEDFLALASTNKQTLPYRRELLAGIYDPLGFLPVSKADMADLEARVANLKNGNDQKPLPVPCPNCGDENFFRRQENGITIEVCRTCLGRGGVG